jgi:hypothetical protein
MRVSLLLSVALLAASAAAQMDSSPNPARDKAVKAVESCNRRDGMSSQQLRNLRKNLNILVDAYRKGDKTVLPVLLECPEPTNFYYEALVADPEGFLTALSTLSEPKQREAAYSIAGGIPGLPQAQFEMIRATLANVPNSSRNYSLARMCLQVLNTQNASMLVSYFPPKTFTGRGGDFELHWFSRDMSLLQEKPMWPPSSDREPTYRLTILPAFSPPQEVSLAVLPDDTGTITFRAVNFDGSALDTDRTKVLSSQNVAEFVSEVDRDGFWQLPTKEISYGFDGAEWILEGVQNGHYHVVVRWSPRNTAFGNMGRSLLKLADVDWP